MGRSSFSERRKGTLIANKSNEGESSEEKSSPRIRWVRGWGRGHGKKGEKEPDCRSQGEREEGCVVMKGQGSYRACLGSREQERLMGTHRQGQPQQPHGALGRALGLGELRLVLHHGEEGLQPHLCDAVSWRKE